MAEPSVFRDGLFAGQVGVVTGGGTGIGFGIAELLASLGMHVVLASRRAEHTDPAAERIRGAGGRASTATLDVRDPDRVKAVMAQVTQEHGRLDLLVNNAAGNFYVPSESMSPNAWRSVIEIDLFGTFFCAQAALPLMRDSGGGSIVNISMTLHYRGWPQMAHATAAKGGIDALTRTLALEWASHRVRVNAVAPGPIPTEGVLKAFARPSDARKDLFGSAPAAVSSLTAATSDAPGSAVPGWRRRRRSDRPASRTDPAGSVGHTARHCPCRRVPRLARRRLGDRGDSGRRWRGMAGSFDHLANFFWHL